MNQDFYDAVTGNPVIAAAKDPEGLAQCLAIEEIQVVFVLYGDICTIGRIVEEIKDAGKLAMVHADLVSGLSNKEIAVDFLRQSTRADGIISTRQSSIRRAQELGLHTILRVFVLDSMALSSLSKLNNLRPDFIEILPGTMPKTIRKICAILPGIPILVGGLIADKEDVMNALEAGAVGISSTSPEVWRL